MMKRIYKISLLVILCLIINTIPVYASTNTKERSEENYLVADWIEVTEANKQKILTTPAVDAEEKVYDFADLFTETEEEKLYANIKEYINNHSMDLAVVTISENNKTPQEYADDFYDYNDFDQSGGVLFLIDMDNREIYMSTTGSAIKMYNDNRINQALDTVYTYMSSENYYEGTSRYIEKISNYAFDGLPNNNTSQEENFIVHDILMSMFSGSIITTIIIGVLIYKNKMVRKATTAREYLNKESVNIKNIGDLFISSNTVKTKIEHESSSRSSRSGGSSTHSGSSGSSHGGGGHSF